MESSPKQYTEDIPMSSPYFSQLLKEQIMKIVKKMLHTIKADKKFPCLVTSNTKYGYASISINGVIGATPTIIPDAKVANHIVPILNTEFYVTGINGSLSNIIVDTPKNMAVNTHMASTPITASYNVWVYDGFISVDSTGGAVVLTLPTAVGMDGHYYVFKRLNAGANAITINPYSVGQTIDGAASYSLTTQYQKVCIIAQGNKWHIVHT